MSHNPYEPPPVPPYSPSTESADTPAATPPLPPQAPESHYPSRTPSAHYYGEQAASQQYGYGNQQYPQGPQPLPYQSQAEQVYQQSIPGYPSYPGYGNQPAVHPGQQAASTSMTFGIIATVMTVLIGWVPFFGLLGVACGVGLGIPAILSSKKAEQQGYNAVAGRSLGWVAIGVSGFWVAVYIFLMTIGAMADSSVSTV
jgi:hypothetical protein